MGCSAMKCCPTACCGDHKRGDDDCEDKDNHPYQNTHINEFELSKYDQVYRKAGMPFIKIHINDFIDQLSNMKDNIQWES